MRLHRIGRVHLVTIEPCAHLIGGNVDGAVASRALDDASRLCSTLARNERGAQREADQHADVGGVRRRMDGGGFSGGGGWGRF